MGLIAELGSEMKSIIENLDLQIAQCYDKAINTLQKK